MVPEIPPNLSYSMFKKKEEWACSVLTKTEYEGENPWVQHCCNKQARTSKSHCGNSITEEISPEGEGRLRHCFQQQQQQKKSVSKARVSWSRLLQFWGARCHDSSHAAQIPGEDYSTQVFLKGLWCHFYHKKLTSCEHLSVHIVSKGLPPERQLFNPLPAPRKLISICHWKQAYGLISWSYRPCQRKLKLLCLYVS